MEECTHRQANTITTLSIYIYKYIDDISQSNGTDWKIYGATYMKNKRQPNTKNPHAYKLSILFASCETMWFLNCAASPLHHRSNSISSSSSKATFIWNVWVGVKNERVIPNKTNKLRVQFIKCWLNTESALWSSDMSSINRCVQMHAVSHRRDIAISFHSAIVANNTSIPLSPITADFQHTRPINNDRSTDSKVN